MRARYNLDKPLAVQYVLYLKNLLVLDLGPSIQSKTTGVNMLIARGFSPSALLGIQSIVAAIIAGISLGTLAALPLAVIARFMRTSMLEAMHQEYIRTAKAKGLSTWVVVFRHGLRNALIPVLSFIGPLFASNKKAQASNPTEALRLLP